MYFTMIPTWGRFHSTLRFQSDASLLLLRVAGFASLTPETGFSPWPPAPNQRAPPPPRVIGRVGRLYAVSASAGALKEFPSPDNGRKEADATDAESEAGYIHAAAARAFAFALPLQV